MALSRGGSPWDRCAQGPPSSTPHEGQIVMTASGASDLDVYDIAFLAGGPARVVETAVVAMLRTGRLRLHSPGQLATADLSRRHPVEAAVLDAVGPTGHRSVDTIRWRVVDDDRLLEVGRRLRSAGLVGRAAGVLGVLHGDHRALAPTRAGRGALRVLRTRAASGDAEVMRVALDGQEGMSDQRLRHEIFECPRTTLEAAGPGRRSRGIDHSDPQLAAYRTGGSAAAGGGYTFMQGDGGAF
jgi:hypothetical protein